jgi:hypothetical protein
MERITGGYHSKGIIFPENTIKKIDTNSNNPRISVNQKERYAIDNLKVNEIKYPSVKMTKTRGIYMGRSAIVRCP